MLQLLSTPWSLLHCTVTPHPTVPHRYAPYPPLGNVPAALPHLLSVAQALLSLGAPQLHLILVLLVDCHLHPRESRSSTFAGPLRCLHHEALICEGLLLLVEARLRTRVPSQLAAMPAAQSHLALIPALLLADLGIEAQFASHRQVRRAPPFGVLGARIAFSLPTPTPLSLPARASS